MKTVFDINGNALASYPSTRVMFEVGNISTTDGYIVNSSTLNYSRSKMYYNCANTSKITVVFKTAQFSNIDSVGIAYYTSDHAFISLELNSTPTNPCQFDIPSNCQYFKLVTYSTQNTKHVEEVDVYGDGISITENYNPNIINTYVGYSCAFNYEVSKGAMGSGRLLLPPNYTVDGVKVPLIVFVHGSGGMLSWDTALGVAGDGLSYKPYLSYLADEGFAVFDCYPWTNKETVESSTYSPVAVAVNINAYLQGIRYVCDRYNVDIEKVSLLCKSQGGHIGHWATTQNIFPFKTVSLFAPSTGFGAPTVLFNSNCRSAVTKYVDFDGTETEISTFISNGQSTNTTVKTFMDKNMAKFLNLIPYAHGITNASMAELYNGNFTDVGSVPQWMLDEGLPSKPTGAAHIYSIASHNEYVRNTDVPIKFWCAFDDTATSSYVNYAIYRWLENGASDVSFRILPTGSGGHHAMDTAANALKSSGTTALGISYTDIPTAYVEVVEFIRLKNGD